MLLRCIDKNLTSFSFLQGLEAVNTTADLVNIAISATADALHQLILILGIPTTDIRRNGATHGDVRERLPRSATGPIVGAHH